jgi:beta-lactam-binding protein with PASTA domain
VPNVVGAAQGDAQQTLADARLKYKTQFAPSTQPEGTVVSESHAGQTVDIGTEIVLTIAQKQQTTPPPPPTTPPPATTAPATTPAN